MSKWEDYNMVGKLKKILKTLKNRELIKKRRPYVTPYQLAILFKDRYPKTYKKLGLDVGGKGTGSYSSLAQYIARWLSEETKKNDSPFEMEFLCRSNVYEISYENGEEIVSSSLGKTNDLSMFRLKIAPKKQN